MIQKTAYPLYRFGKALSLFLTMTLAMAMLSCDDANDNDYTPGTPTPENCMTVYFNIDNTAEGVFEEGTPVVKEITLTRKVTDADAEVPIVCRHADSEIKVPSSVTFKAGEATAVLTITAEGLESSKVYNYDIEVGDAYADPYAAVSGSTRFSGTMVIATWKPIVKDATMKWSNLNVSHEWTTDIERLGNLDRYRVRNFAGSNLDIEFIPYGESSYGKAYQQMKLGKNVEEYDDGSVKGYLLYDVSAGNYPSWNTGNIVVKELCLMTLYGTKDYCYISFKDRFANFGVYYTTYTDDTYDYYNYVTLSWKEENETK